MRPRTGTHSRRSFDGTRRRKSVLRRLSVERLESRSLPAADFFAPPVLDFHDDRAFHCSVESSERVDSLSGDASRLDSLFGEQIDSKPALDVELGRIDESSDETLRADDFAFLQIELYGLSSIDARDADLQIVIGYDPSFLEIDQMVIVRGADGCSPEAVDENSELTVRLQLSDIKSDAIRILVPVRILRAGSSQVAITALTVQPRDSAGTAEVFATESTDLTAAESSGETNPYSPPDEALPTPLSDAAIPLMKNDSSSSSTGLLPTRRLSPKSTITGNDADLLQITITRGRGQLRTEDDATMKVVRRAQDARAELEWQLAHDAAFMLYRPLESGGDSSADLIAEIISPSKLPKLVSR